MARSRVYLYPYAGPGGRNYLGQQGTLEDLRNQGILLQEGMVLDFYCGDADDEGKPDDLVFKGTVHYDAGTDRWFVMVDESSYHAASDDYPEHGETH